MAKHINYDEVKLNKIRNNVMNDSENNREIDLPQPY